MTKKIIDSKKFLEINPETGDRHFRITSRGIENVSDFFIKKVKFIGKINKDDVETEMTIGQFNDWLSKRDAFEVEDE